MCPAKLATDYYWFADSTDSNLIMLHLKSVGFGKVSNGIALLVRP